MPGVIVVGGGIAGLVAARELAIGGCEVTLLEASDALGGRVARHTVAGIDLDAGAESFATRGGTVAAFVDELGLADAIVERRTAPAPGCSRPTGTRSRCRRPACSASPAPRSPRT